jgi:hypothetical protein
MKPKANVMARRNANSHAERELPIHRAPQANATTTKDVSKRRKRSSRCAKWTKCCLFLWLAVAFSCVIAYENSHELSIAFWVVVNKYSHLLDRRLDACFEEIPKVSGLFSEPSEPTVLSCPIGPAPRPRLDSQSKKSTIVQYSWAPNVKPFSSRCQAYAKELYSPEKKFINLYGLQKLHTLERANPSAGRDWYDDLDKLPKVQLREELMRFKNCSDCNTLSPVGVPAEMAAARQFFHRTEKITRRSVLMALFDALGRANYDRLISPSMKELMKELKSMANGKDGGNDGDGGDYYNLFEFTRFSVIAHTSKRNYKAVYTGHTPELFDGLMTGTSHPEYMDKDTCAKEMEELLSSPSSSALGRLGGRCRKLIWGTYRDQGYLTADLGVAKVDELGEYFNQCDKSCGNTTHSELWKIPSNDANDVGGLGPLVSALPPDNMGTWNSAAVSLRAMAGTFHSLAFKGGPPIFATEQSLDTHNNLQGVGSVAYLLKGLIKSLRASAMKNSVPLPLLVLHADHGPHYGDIQLTRAGRVEHKFGVLVLFVPERMFKEKPNMRDTLKTNTKRLVSAFDLHHSMLELAKDEALKTEEKRGGTSGKDESELAGIEKLNIFKQIVPADRPCSKAGVEKYLCLCDVWTATTEVDMPAVRYLMSTIVIPHLNERLMQMLGELKRSVIKNCAKKLVFDKVADAETSSKPSSLKAIMSVGVYGSTRTIKFSVSMLCEDTPTCNLRNGRCDGGERFIPKTSSACKLTTIDRITSMTKTEDMVYKAAGKSSSGGKLCVVP